MIFKYSVLSYEVEAIAILIRRTPIATIYLDAERTTAALQRKPDQLTHPTARREAGKHLRSAIDMSERRAGRAIGADRANV